MLENAGIVGVRVLEEAYDQLELHVEEFFDVRAEQPGQVDGFESDAEMSHPGSPSESSTGTEDVAIFVTGPAELAVVEPRRHFVKYVGTGGLYNSIAVLMACPFTGRYGCVHVSSAQSAQTGVAQLSSLVTTLSPFAVENGASKTDGYCSSSVAGPQRRRKSGPVVDVYLCGGFQDSEGLCESILNEVLSYLLHAPHRFSLKMICAGLLNDSHHNGNDEDKQGPQCALITACALKLHFDASSNSVSHSFAPVSKFVNRGPALELRMLRAFEKRGETTENPHSCPLVPYFTNVYCIETGNFVIQPFQVDPLLDRQTVLWLLHLAVTDASSFLSHFSIFPVTIHATQSYVRDACRSLCFLLENARRVSSSKLFEDGELRFEAVFMKQTGGPEFWKAVGATGTSWDWRLKREDYAALRMLSEDGDKKTHMLVLGR